ncbi:MAG: NUDIX domain-containing protein [Minisyncoccales bacterium]
MENVKVCLIIKNKNGDLLLQLRDEEPEIDKWVLFGGGVGPGETNEQALAREIKEELGFTISGVKFFGEYKDNGIKQMIYVLDEPAAEGDLVLAEGKAMKFFSLTDIEGSAIGFNFKQIIRDYFEEIEKIYSNFIMNNK